MSPSFFSVIFMKTKILLHTCCAPCSSAIVEWLIQHDYEPIIFYHNPNIFPYEEYEIRKKESKRFAESLHLQWIEGENNHELWLKKMEGLEDQPERGSRCLECFRYRMLATAQCAKSLGISLFATTLASSRWKSLSQIALAGHEAVDRVGGDLQFFDKNWRKDGLQNRRNELLKQYNFYNQQYCGCEFSMKK